MPGPFVVQKGDWNVVWVADSEESNGRCDAIYPEGRCKDNGRVEILSRDFYTTGMKVVVMFCFDCANDAISSGIFEPINNIGVDHE